MLKMHVFSTSCNRTSLHLRNFVIRYLHCLLTVVSLQLGKSLLDSSDSPPGQAMSRGGVL